MILPEPEATVVTSYIGQGMPRFVLASDPLLPNPAYGQIVVMTDGPHQRDALKAKIRNMIADGHFPAARVRAKQFVFGPPVNYEVLFRVVGPDANGLRSVGRQVKEVMDANPNLRNVRIERTTGASGGAVTIPGQ